MTRTQGDTLQKYRQEFERSRRWRHNAANNFDDAWKRYSDLYAGKHYDTKNNADQLTVNMIFATINVMGPAVAINNPKFAVNARSPESAPQAILTEEVLNYLWRTHDYQRDFRLAVHDWLIMGHGWLKAGYKATKKPEVKETNSDIVDTTAEGMDELGVDDRDASVKDQVESELQLNDTDRPFLERISPFDMFVDPDARHPKEMRWVAQRTWRPLKDVQVDSRYSATARKQATGSSWSRWNDEDGDARNPQDKPQSTKTVYAEIIEYYSIALGEVSTFCRNGDDPEGRMGSGGFLIKPRKMPYEFGHPFVMLRNYEVPDTFYPMGDVQQIESLQLELNETRNQMLNYRKKFRRAWLYAEDRFSRDGIAGLQSEDDNVMIPVLGDMDPSSAISPVPPSITPPEFFDQSAMISADIDRISGVSDYQRGGQQNSVKRTATEAAMIQDSANARAQDRLAKIEGVLAECGERIIQLMQQFVTEEQVARVVTMPIKAWFKFDADRIKGQFDYEVIGGSTEPQNETFRRQSAMQTVDLSMPFIDAGIVNMPALYQKLLRDGMGIKDAERYIQQPQEQGPPPGEPPLPGGPPGMEGGAPPPMGAMPPQGAPPPGPPSPGGGMPQELTPEMFAQMAMEAQGGMMPPGGGGMPPGGAMPPVGPDGMPLQQGMGPEGEIPPELLQMLLQGGSPLSG
jgi:hypothetical protein